MGRLAAVVLWLWTAAVAAEYMKYKDSAQPVKARVKDLLSRMTLEEKIGQMAQIEREVTSPDVIKNFFIGTFSLDIFNFLIFFDFFFEKIFGCLIVE